MRATMYMSKHARMLVLTLVLSAILPPAYSADCAIPTDRKLDTKGAAQNEITITPTCLNEKIKQIDADFSALKGVMVDIPMVSAYEDDFLKINLIGASRPKVGVGRGVALSLLLTNKTEDDLLIAFNTSLVGEDKVVQISDESGQNCVGPVNGISARVGNNLQNLLLYTLVSPHGTKPFSLQSPCFFLGTDLTLAQRFIATMTGEANGFLLDLLI